MQQNMASKETKIKQETDNAHSASVSTSTKNETKARGRRMNHKSLETKTSDKKNYKTMTDPVELLFN